MTADDDGRVALATNLPPSYALLLREGHLFHSCLSQGMTSIAAADRESPGACYSAFFNLSIGLERLLKVVLIIDHMAKNELRLPDLAVVKDYGHSLGKLFSAAQAATKQPLFPPQMPGTIEADILKHLDDFARVSRYHNLDTLSTQAKLDDPLATWGRILDRVLNSDVSRRWSRRVLDRDTAIGADVAPHAIGVGLSLGGQWVSFSSRIQEAGQQRLALPHVRVRVHAVLNSARLMLERATEDALNAPRGLHPDSGDVPNMTDFTNFLFVKREFLLRKKRWP